MSKENEMKTVAKGDMFIQDNQERKFGSDPQYAVLWAVLPDGGQPVPLLLTKEELDIAVERAAQNEEDIPALGSEAAVTNFDTEN
jgi:hypothetical protein